MAGLLNIGVSALTAFQRALNTTGHNIANSDTVGYSRQRTELSARPPQPLGDNWVGTGVKVTDVQRMYDDFLAQQVRTAQSTTSGLDVYHTYARRIDNLLADPDVGLNPAVQDFFNAMQGWADDPASIYERQVLLSESDSMVNRFHDLSGQFNDMRDQLNKELDYIINEVNSFADSFARLNRTIIEAVGAGRGEPNDLLDQRELLLKEISARVDISVVPQDDGAWNLFIGKGQALVMGVNAATLATVRATSDPTQYDVAFVNLNSTQVVTDQLTGGEVGGLLSFRDDILDGAQNQLGLVALGISDRINAQNRLGLDLQGNFGGAVFDAGSIDVVTNANNAGSATVTGAFVDTGNLTASDYELQADNVANQYTLTRRSDGQTWTFNTGGVPYTWPPGPGAEQDGFSITITPGAVAGDRFLIRPTRKAAESLTLEISDPRKLAAAGPLRAKPTTNAITSGPNQGDGSIGQPAVTSTAGLPLAAAPGIILEWSPTAAGGNPGFTVTNAPFGPIPYDPATDAGNTYDFAGFGLGDMSFTISGTPQNGDRFLIENNTGGVGDNRNALAMADLQSQNTLLGTTGGGGPTATFQEVYAQLVSDVGTKTFYSEVNLNSSSALLEHHEMELSAISGVNLDEEAANLVRYQQAYQAAAQTISVARTLFDSLISAVR